jgi:hypothetical protein
VEPEGSSPQSQQPWRWHKNTATSGGHSHNDLPSNSQGVTLCKMRYCCMVNLTSSCWPRCWMHSGYKDLFLRTTQSANNVGHVFNSTEPYHWRPWTGRFSSDERNLSYLFSKWFMSLNGSVFIPGATTATSVLRSPTEHPLRSSVRASH